MSVDHVTRSEHYENTDGVIVHMKYLAKPQFLTLVGHKTSPLALPPQETSLSDKTPAPWSFTICTSACTRSAASSWRVPSGPCSHVDSVAKETCIIPSGDISLDLLEAAITGWPDRLSSQRHFPYSSRIQPLRELALFEPRQSTLGQILTSSPIPIVQPLIATIYGTISLPWKSAIVCPTRAHPARSPPLKDRSGKDTFNWFPVRSIKDELEDLLAIAEVQELLEEQAKRGRKPTDAPLAAG
ncbi:hypothetical protein D1P53_004432 [Cryptococcus gattii VGV]|nr:hypothetical protein D1P53_004432 [Cryptococcus gattii VGV]